MERIEISSKPAIKSPALARAEIPAQNSALKPERGVSPRVLLNQVRNTLPFLFADSNFSWPFHLEFLRNTDPDPELTHAQYYRLCLAAHHATVGSFVPTDVDNQIRFKLWHPKLSLEILAEMAKTTLESRLWDFTPVSHRWVASPVSGEKLAGHHGEWFSTAIGAYCALRRKLPEMAAEMASEILREIQREADIFSQLKAKREGIDILKAATLIAHNLGDLDRVMEIWNLPDDDPLKQAAYKLGHQNPERYHGHLIRAGALNKLYICDENHRHFALRAVRCLRKHPDFLLPIGPFLDDWGGKIARHPSLSPEEVGQVSEALVDGWEKLNRPGPTTGRIPVGYSRALSGILDAFPGGFQRLSQYVPAKIARTLKAGPLRAQISNSRARFADQWNTLGNSNPF